MLPCIDLLALLRELNGSLSGVSIYGRVEEACRRPATLDLSVKLQSGGTFMYFDMMAVDFSTCRDSVKSTLRERGIEARAYFVNGSVVTYLPDTVKSNEWGIIQGTLILSKRSKFPLTSVFGLTKDAGKWVLHKSSFNGINLSSIDSDVGGVIESCCRRSVFERPEEVNNFEPCMAKITMGIFSKPKLAKEDDVHHWEGVSVRTPELKLSDRDSIVPKSSSLLSLQDSCDILIKNRKNYISSVRDKFMLSSRVCDNIRFTFSRLNTYYRRGMGASHTGIDILTSYVRKMREVDTQGDYTEYVEKYVRSSHKGLFDSCLKGDPLLFIGTDGEMSAMNNLFGFHEVTYAGILATILDLDILSLRLVASDCYSNMLSFARILDENPYILAILFPDLDLEIVEKLALSFGKANDPDLKNYKNAVYVWRNLYSCVCGATCCLDRDLYKRKIGVSVTREEYDLLKRKNGVFSMFVLSDIELFLNTSISVASTTYPIEDLVQDGSRGYIQPLSKDEIMSCRKAFDYLGLVKNFEINNNSWSVAVDVLMKELFIYDFLQDLESTDNILGGIDDTILDTLICEFESKTGTSLNEKQCKAVKLLKHNTSIISETVGSDKSTVLRCISYVAENYKKARDGASIDIKYVSATSGSLESLSRCIGKPVELLRSLLKANKGVSYTSIDCIEDKSKCICTDILILDDISVLALDTMYSVLKQVNASKIIFICDINKLPPKGRGTPFKDMLRYLPSVNLSIADDCPSPCLAKNAELINEVGVDLVEGVDFKLVPCEDSSISGICNLLYEYHLNPERKGFISQKLRDCGLPNDILLNMEKLTPDDIQVVSISTIDRSRWSESSINSDIKGTFNPVIKTTKSFKTVCPDYISTTFSVGDRVVSTKTDYTLQWYSSYRSGRLTRTTGSGVFEGDAGKIIDLIPSTSCSIEGVRDTSGVRDDSAHQGINCYFVIVEYSDTTTGEVHYVVYQGVESYTNSSFELLALSGDDMSKLRLSYCVTPDKLQSRKSKLVIMLLGNLGRNEGVSRNMIYDSISCATEGMYLMGSVTFDDDSQLSIARRFVADKLRHTVCSCFMGD